MSGNPFEFTAAQQAIPALRAPGPKWPGRRLWPGYNQPFRDANVWETGAGKGVPR